LEMLVGCSCRPPCDKQCSQAYANGKAQQIVQGGLCAFAESAVALGSHCVLCVVHGVVSCGLVIFTSACGLCAKELRVIGCVVLK